MKSLTLYLLFALAAISTFVSCGENYVYDHYRSVSVGGWNRADTLDFNVGKIPAGTYELLVGFRATSEYPYKELGIDVSYSTSPSSKPVHKRVKCVVFDDDGRLLGKNGISSNDFLYNVGTLTVGRSDSIVVSIAHAMNQEIMPGLTQIGLQLEPR